MTGTYILRAPGKDDLAEAVTLLNAQAVSLYGEPDTSESEILEEWETPGFVLDTDVRLAELPDGRIVGYADFFNTRRKQVRPFSYVAVHPDYPDDALCDALVAWAVRRAHDDVPRAPEGARITLTGGVEAANTRVLDAWLNAGFTEARRFYQMRIDFTEAPSPAAVPDGYTIRPARPDETRAVYDATRESFRDHYGHVPPASLEDDYRQWLHHYVEYDEFDSSLQLVAVDDSDSIVGMSLCRPNDGANESIGWVGTLGVLREHRRRGIAEALLRRTFEGFYERGKAGVALGVDAESLTGATRLYEKCGMYQRRVFINLEKMIRDGEELANLG